MLQEVYLWHGTNVRAALSIAQNDFRIDLAGSSTGTMRPGLRKRAEACSQMLFKDAQKDSKLSLYSPLSARYGLGAYLAEHCTKADEYSSDELLGYGLE